MATHMGEQMATKVFAAVAAILIAVAAFSVGYRVGGNGEFRPTVYIGDGSSGADVATLQAGGTSYGFRTTVAWTDASGSYHSDGWPDCLPRQAQLTGVRFAGAMVMVESGGEARVLWVDCRKR
jgi:hypothetical protein